MRKGRVTVVHVEERIERQPGAAVKQSGPMTGGEALVASLVANGIDTIFALPGVQLDGAFDALYDATDEISVIHTRHEQAAAYMADGYARVTGRVGTCLVVPGPGLLNASAALSTAYACNSPVLCVTGQIQSDLIEFGRGLLHEIPNQLGMVRSVTKQAERATTPDAVPGLVDRAMREVRAGRPRPVEIEVPPDTLLASQEVRLLGPAPAPTRSAGDPDQLAELARLLANAKTPLIWAGGGVVRSGASEALAAVADRLQAPVVMTSNGKGAISDRDELAQHLFVGIDLLPKADVVLAVGTRFVDPTTSYWGLEPGRTVAQIDIDPEELGRNYPDTLAIQADAKAALEALADLLDAQGDKRASRRAELQATKEAFAARALAVGPQAEYAMAIRRVLPDDGVFVSEMTQVGYWSNMAFPVYQPNTYITPGYQGTLGWGFPTSLGAKVGAGSRPVVSINGDGGFGFCLNELATMAMHDIPTVVVVFNDSAYGNVRRIQREQYRGRTIASHLQNPDYAKLAGAFGVAARRAETPDALATQLREAFKADEPTLVEVPIGPVPNPWTALGIRR